MNSLRVALAQLRRGAPGALEANEMQVAALVRADAARLLDDLEAGRLAEAVDGYTGAFLPEFYLPDMGAELEEWLYSTREVLAERVRGALLVLAEADAAVGDFTAGRRRAETALRLSGAAPPEPETLTRLHRLLLAGGSPVASELYGEARSYGVSLDTSRETARSRLSEGTGRLIPNKLPVPPTSFIGRDPELLELAHLLADADTRLITLIGVGGVGKSRLALQAAHNELRGQHFRGGVFFIPLEALQDEDLIPASIAQALDIGLTNDLSGSELARALGDRNVLLVLDNCEHLPATAHLVADLLAHGPGLKLLATSREPLNLSGEQLFRVEGLPLAQGELRLEHAQYGDAVRLFVRRAKRAHLQFALSEDNLPHVLAVCRQLEGSPLGIELAAAWVRLMPPDAIAAEIGRSLDFLSGSSRDVSDRHRSLRAAFDSSWKLLSSAEQMLLRKLSVFEGGFTQRAASQVAGSSIARLASLVDKSLLRVLGEGRYDRHPLIYAFSAEKLTEHAEEKRSTQEAHAAYFAAMAEEADAHPSGAEQIIWLARLEREHDNLRAALRWALAGADVELGLRLAVRLYRFWYYRSHFAEGRRWLHAALERSEDLEPEPELLRAKALHAAGVLATEQGDTDTATTLFERHLRLARRSGDKAGEAASLNSLGIIAWGQHELTRARALIEKSLALRRELGRDELLPRALSNLGLVVLALGNYNEARAIFEESLSLSRRLEQRLGIAIALSNLGAVEVDQADAPGARTRFEDALALYREVGDKDGVAHCLEGFAAVATLQGRYKDAARLSGAADALREAIGSVLQPSDAARRARRLAPARAALGESDFEAAWAEGKGWSLEESSEFALEATELESPARRGE